MVSCPLTKCSFKQRIPKWAGWIVCAGKKFYTYQSHCKGTFTRSGFVAFFFLFGKETPFAMVLRCCNWLCGLYRWNRTASYSVAKVWQIAVKTPQNTTVWKYRNCTYDLNNCLYKQLSHQVSFDFSLSCHC